MTDSNKFRAVIVRNGLKFWQVSSMLGISPQSLYNKIGNATQFTQSELAKFREIFPDVTDDEFYQIFFAEKITAEAN